MKNKNKKPKKFNRFQALFDIKWWFYDFVKITGFIPAILYYRPKYYYLNKASKKEFKRNNFVIASNHNSLKDPLTMLVMFYFKRLGIVGTKELFNTKFKNALFTGFNCIKIDKENVSMSTFKQVNNTILRGHNVVIFPEGTIAHEKDYIAEFKSGVIFMALMAKSAIYPVYIVKRHHWYERQRIVIGEKFDVLSMANNGKMNSSEMEQCASKLRDKMIELENYYLNNIKKNTI